MNYEQKYAKALWQMKELYNRVKYLSSTEALLVSQTLENTFPELKESEDERIKRCIGMCLTDATEQRFEDFNTNLKDCLAWLEKQGEQKPSWSEEDSKRLDRIHQFIWANRKGDTDEIYQQEQDADWLMTLKPQPKQEWSEEDERQIRQIERIVKDSGATKNLQEQIHNWLESLKSNYWKPSEEQMEAIKFCCANFEEYDALKSLYNDLKTLI